MTPAGGAAPAPPLLELSGVSKHFGGTTALQDVDLTLRPGSVHALLGENGAGKSTLGKIIGGVHAPDAGVLRVDGMRAHFRHPADALALGITVMQQEIALAPDLSVMENVLLGQYPARGGLLDRRRMREQYDELVARSGFDLPRDRPAGDLPLALQQQVEILRALGRNARIIVMDEPTAALPATAAEELHAVVRNLRDRGVSIVYISHFLDETLALSDEVTVLRGGRIVSSSDAGSMTLDSVVEAMLGRSQASTYPALPPVRPEAPTRLAVTGVKPKGQAGAGASLTIHAGEIVGLFGLVGSGRSQLAHAVFGASGHVDGEIRLNDQSYSPTKPVAGLRRGIALLPESRRDQGLFLDHGQLRNTVVTALRASATWGVVRPGREKRRFRAALEKSGASNHDPHAVVGGLSGGNQQKVLLAKSLCGDPRVLILDEPTRGVDVGARRVIYDALTRLADGGAAILLISSDLEEAQQMSHRLCVMREGEIVAEFASTGASHGDILNAAFGLTPDLPARSEVPS